MKGWDVMEGDNERERERGRGGEEIGVLKVKRRRD